MPRDPLDRRYSRLLQLIQAGLLVGLSGYRAAFIGDIRNVCDPLLEDYVEDQDIELAVNGLVTIGYVDYADPIYSVGRRDGGYSLTDRGVDYVSSKLSERDNFVYNYRLHGEAWLTGELESAYEDIGTLEPIRRNANPSVDARTYRKELDEIADALTLLARAIRSSNSFSSALDLQTETALKKIEEGAAEVRKPADISVSRLERLFYGPLSHLAQKFEHTAVSDMVQQAWKLIKEVALQLLA